jgi:hypothetical protein
MHLDRDDNRDLCTQHLTCTNRRWCLFWVSAKGGKSHPGETPTRSVRCQANQVHLTLPVAAAGALP